MFARALLIVAIVAHAAHADDKPPDRTRAKVIAAASIGAIHIAYATWSYFAWYRGADSEKFYFAKESWFGDDTYAGGADKFGHAWSNYTLTRATTGVLVAAGWPRFPSSLVSAGLTELAFTLTEIQDGYVFGFETRDMIANVSGAAFGVLMENVPEVDRLLDFRVAYFPSRDFRRAFRKMNSVDVGQDYTGQTFLLGLHLGALPHALDSRWTSWTRFVDLAWGFQTRNYSPVPMPRVDPREQTVFVGLSLNMQGVLRAIFPCDTTGRRIGIGAAEVLQIPYTTLAIASHSHYPDL